MSYVTQGTIQVKKIVDPTGKAEVFKALVTPVSDYHIKHRDKDYSVLIEKSASKLARACTPEEEFDVETSVRDVLTEAASRRIPVEVEVEVVPPHPRASPRVDTYNIVAVQMPATVPKPR